VLTVAVLLTAGPTRVSADDGRSKVIQGGGTTIVTGGGPGLAPVITKFDFHWRDGEGKFECLALIPSSPASSAGSGNFDKNIMYVTGKILSAEIDGPVATLKVRIHSPPKSPLASAVFNLSSAAGSRPPAHGITPTRPANLAR